MNTRCFVAPSVAVLVAASCLTVMVPGVAVAADGPWLVRVSALTLSPTGDSVLDTGTGERIPYDTDRAYGFGFEVEYRASRRLGLDFGVLTATPVIDALIDEVGGITAAAEPRMTPVYVALDVHLTPDSPVDVYLGPLVAYVVYSSFDLVVDPWFMREGFETRNDFGIGGNFGLDLRLGDSGWSLGAALKYLDTTLEASPPDESIGVTDIDPWIFSVGIGYRF